MKFVNLVYDGQQRWTLLYPSMLHAVMTAMTSSRYGKLWVERVNVRVQNFHGEIVTNGLKLLASDPAKLTYLHAELSCQDESLP